MTNTNNFSLYSVLHEPILNAQFLINNREILLRTCAYNISKEVQKREFCMFNVPFLLIQWGTFSQGPLLDVTL